MNVLVVAAHPDDEVLGCGGTIARLAAEGAAVSILILAEGLTSRTDFDTRTGDVLLRQHHERAQRAGQLLGAREVVVAGFPDNQMDTVPLLQVAQRIETEIKRVKPAIVFTQHGGDLNIDHVVTFRATLTATRPIQGSIIPQVYAYEVASSTEWAFQQFEPKFAPQVFYRLSEAQLEQKIAAMQVYESEKRDFPHPRSPDALRAIARRWGSVIGAQAAEAFACVRDIR